MKLRELPLFRAVTEARHAVRNGTPLDDAAEQAGKQHHVEPHHVAGFLLVMLDHGNRSAAP
jgi:2-methylaconitate cis-trans-isomerase PrpF